jgi:hypothetical protein
MGICALPLWKVGRDRARLGVGAWSHRAAAVLRAGVRQLRRQAALRIWCQHRRQRLVPARAARAVLPVVPSQPAASARGQLRQRAERGEHRRLHRPPPEGSHQLRKSPAGDDRRADGNLHPRSTCPSRRRRCSCRRDHSRADRSESVAAVRSAKGAVPDQFENGTTAGGDCSAGAPGNAASRTGGPSADGAAGANTIKGTKAAAVSSPDSQGWHVRRQSVFGRDLSSHAGGRLRSGIQTLAMVSVVSTSLRPCVLP